MPTKVSKKDDAWHDYVFEFFKESELIDGNPTCNGLRRVCEKVYGPIMSCRTEVLKAPTDHERSATVMCTIKCLEIDETGNERVVTQSAAADVCEENTIAPYNQHPVATAETRAEGRALRKILNLDCTTYEEIMSADAETRDVRISETHARSIRNMVNKLNLDIEKFLSKEAGAKSEWLDKGPNAISKTAAIQLLETLTEYHTGRQPIPDDIKSSEAANQDTELSPTPTCSDPVPSV